jgi:hypothetical protein
MPDYDEMFPSKYMKATDLDGKEFRVTISGLRSEKVVDTEPEKWILYFQGSDRGMVLNQTNGATLMTAYGKNTDGWINQAVILYAEMTSYQNKMGLRVRPDGAGHLRHATGQQPPMTESPPPPSEGPPPPPNDDLPF